MSNSHKGFKHSEYSKMKMSNALGGKKFSDTHKENMRAAFKNRQYAHICSSCGKEFKSKSNKSKWCSECKE